MRKTVVPILLMIFTDCATTNNDKNNAGNNDTAEYGLSAVLRTCGLDRASEVLELEADSYWTADRKVYFEQFTIKVKNDNGCFECFIKDNKKHVAKIECPLVEMDNTRGNDPVAVPY